MTGYRLKNGPQLEERSFHHVQPGGYWLVDVLKAHNIVHSCESSVKHYETQLRRLLQVMPQWHYQGRYHVETPNGEHVFWLHFQAEDMRDGPIRLYYEPHSFYTVELRSDQQCLGMMIPILEGCGDAKKLARLVVREARRMRVNVRDRQSPIAYYDNMDVLHGEELDMVLHGLKLPTSRNLNFNVAALPTALTSKGNTLLLPTMFDHATQVQRYGSDPATFAVSNLEKL